MIYKSVLAREKKRALWSLAIGVIMAPAALSFWYIRARSVDARLQSLVANCKKKGSASTPSGASLAPGSPAASATPNSTAISPEEAKRLWAKRLGGPETGGEILPGHHWVTFPGGHWGPPYVICDPDSLMRVGELKGEAAQIVNAAREADDDRANGRLFGLAVLLLSCLPLFWYFLLDRIREVSAAISGRDGMR